MKPHPQRPASEQPKEKKTNLAGSLGFRKNIPYLINHTGRPDGGTLALAGLKHAPETFANGCLINRMFQFSVEQ